MSVSFVKQAGGAAVPIFVDQPDEYYEQLIPRLNAVYLPGGSSHNLDSPYAETAMRIFRYVMYPRESCCDFYCVSIIIFVMLWFSGLQ